MASGLDQSETKFNNYVALITALKLTKEGLEEYVNIAMKDMYKKISNKCRGYLDCRDNCSKMHVANFDKWCDTCKKWREEIALYMRNKERISGVHWNKFESMIWSGGDKLTAINQVANVFVHKCRNPMISVADDISSIVSLFENCKYFCFEQKLLSDVREVRNKHFAHNSTYTIEENDLLKCLDVLCRLLNNRTLKADNKCKEKYTEICSLKSKMKRVNSKDVSEIKSNLYSFVSLHNDKPDIVVQKAEDILSNKHSPCVRKRRHRRYDLLLLFIFVLCYQFKMQWNSNDDLPGKGNSSTSLSFINSF